MADATSAARAASAAYRAAYAPGRWACADHAQPGLYIDSEEEPRDDNGYPVERRDCYAHGCKRPGVVKLRWVPCWEES